MVYTSSVYTIGLKTVPIMDLSKMVGKMDVLENLIRIAAGKPGSKDPIYDDEEAYIVPRLDMINKGFEVSIIQECGDEEHSAEIFEVKDREDDLLGFNEVDGFPFYGVGLGDGYFFRGVLGIIVTDGTKLYLYIPLRGNSLNQSSTNPKWLGHFEDSFSQYADAVQVDKDMIYDDIRVAFNIGKGSKVITATSPTTGSVESTASSEEASSTSEAATSTPSSPSSGDSFIDSISKEMDDLVELVGEFTDDGTKDSLKKGMDGILESIKKERESDKFELWTMERSLEDYKNDNARLEKKVKYLKDKKDDLEEQNEKLRDVLLGKILVDLKKM